MEKFLVEFGFEVEANNNEQARKRAKRNLKPKNKRVPVSSYKSTRI